MAAVFITAVGIFASDSLRGVGSQFALIGSSSSPQICDEGSTFVQSGEMKLCVDIYEASPSETCPKTNVSSVIQSEENTNNPRCFPKSRKDAEPWAYVTLSQAQRVCASVGKRLPTSNEWYTFALGVDLAQCTKKEDKASNTGTRSCVSSSGIHDTVGNVWEWMNEQVNGKVFRDLTLPSEGYVTSAGIDGVPLTTSESPDSLYGEDYIWTKEEGVFGMIRGGFYSSGNDAGLYTVNASVAPNFASQGVGFRCVKDIAS